MRRLLALYSAINDGISAVVLTLGAAIVAFAVLALFGSAVERHVSGVGYTWLIDFPPLLLPWAVFPILGLLIRYDRHVRVELLLAGLDVRGRSLVRLVAYLTCVVVGVVFGVASADAVAFFRQLGEVSETEIQVPLWTLYLSFPVGFGLLANFAFERALIECRRLAAGDDADA